MRTLLPLYVHPENPVAWQAAVGRHATVVINAPEEPGATADAGSATGTTELGEAHPLMLGYVDLGYATRPLAHILDDVRHWAAYPVGGIFFDAAPTSPFSIGPVARAIRVARRGGLPHLILSPGAPTDPLYRDLGVPICTFEGDWVTYQRWSGEGSEPGDGHLVYGVPAAQLPAAHRLLRSRNAGFGHVTDRGLPDPYGGLPAPVGGLAPAR